MTAAQRRQLAERIAHGLLRVYFENGMISKESMRDAVRPTELHIENAEKADRLERLEQHGYGRTCDEH